MFESSTSFSEVKNISNNNDKSTFTIDSPNPLQPQELAELVGADGVATRVDRKRN